ncbi:MAG: hypothetical protein H0X44_07000 [Acidobacteria bacterium]|nr:hypothetical protein [Acidobacteriota bacterium]
MAIALILLTAALTPALAWRDRLAAADVGLGGFPFNISPLDYYDLLSPAQAVTLAAFGLVWIFLSGGIIDRLARGTRSSGTRFFAACGACFLPLVRLALITTAAYWAVLAFVTPALAALASGSGEYVHLVLYGLLALLLFALSLTLDYARVRLVIEDRRSAIGAVGAAWRMLRAHGRRMLGIQALFWLMLVGWIALRGAAAATSADDWTAGRALAVVTIFAAGELILKLALTGAQAALYQDVLASAGWVARAEPAWPDDPSSDPQRGPLHPA